MIIRRCVCLLLMMGTSVPGGSADPVTLLNQAHQIEAKKHDHGKALALLKKANAIWESQHASSAEYGQSLTLAAILFAREREDSGKLDPSAAEGLARAVGIFRANPASKPEDLALALEVQALIQAGKQMEETAEWKEAAGIRARRFSEALPGPADLESPAAHLDRGPDPAKPPKLVSKVEPTYSEAARILRINGSVRMSINIEADGTPSSASMKHGLGFGLDEEALKAVRQWRFQPASKDGAAIRTRATIEVSFRLL